MSNFPDKDFRFQFSHEEEKPMGSGGALLYAKQLLQNTESFFAINSDEVFVPSRPDILAHLQAHHNKTKSLLTLLVTDHPELGKSLKPIWVDGDGNVVAFGEKPNKPGLRPVHYTGCKIFSKDVLPLLPAGESHIFHDTVVPAIKNGAIVNTVHDQCQWWETGNYDSFLAATSDVIDIISKNSSNYFDDVYKFLGRKLEMNISINGANKSAIHKSLVLQDVKTSGVVFADQGVRIAPHLKINNSLINTGAIVDSSLDNVMVL